MTADEIRKISVESSDTYFNYLKEHEKGVQEVHLFELEYLRSSDMVIKIRLSSKIVDTEGLFFKNLTNGKSYDTAAVKIIEYDSEKNIMLIKPGNKAKPDFQFLRNNDLRVIIDLKFLVLRVKKWYENWGGQVRIPIKISKHADTYQNIEYFEEPELHPSENQKQALATLFTNPFTYVWGAPGTGKTQFVLAYAILHYIKNGDKVAIFAPTNNAIEQVLSGVLKMTDKAGVDRKQLIRIGTPSKKFADQYPEVCEDFGINKKIFEIDNQIDLMERVISFHETKEMILKAKESIPPLEELVEMYQVVKKDKNERKPYLAHSKPIIEKIKQEFSQIPDWQIFVEDLNLFNCKMVHKELVSFLSMQEKQLETDETFYYEYQSHNAEQMLQMMERLNDEKNHLEQSSTKERMKKVNVVAYTLDGFIANYDESKLAVDHVFLDEAGYANIIKALPLMSENTPVTFFGDHKQLPPVCEVNDFEITRDETYKNMFLWAQSAIFLDSLFVQSFEYCRDQFLTNARLSPTQMVQCSLNGTYRFGNNLASVLARFVYTRDFHSLQPKGETQIFFVNGPKVDPLKSRTSINEVIEIKKIVQRLKDQDMNDFVILTPYKNQIRLLNKYLITERNDNKILTVHGSQGREWETVILSVVDTSDKWFVNTKLNLSKGLNLINTAVSRAKKNLIIVCDLNYWQNQPGQLISELIRTGRKI